MIKLLPILLIVLAGLAWMKVSSMATGAGLRRQSRPLKNDQLEGMLRRLADTAGVEDIRVRVIEAPMINGLATPQGDIYVTRGLVREAQRGRITASEFASVVAHELGHLALGHTKRRMIDVMGAQAATAVLGGLLARFIPFIGWHLARGVANLFIARLSRRDEFEADAYATALMVRSGLGAEPQARMLEKLGHLSPGGPQPDGPASWLASHPPVADRASAIRANAARWESA